MSRLALGIAICLASTFAFGIPSGHAAGTSPTALGIQEDFSGTNAADQQPMLMMAQYVRGGRMMVGPRGTIARRTSFARGPRGTVARRTTFVRGPTGRVYARRTTIARGPRGTVVVRRMGVMPRGAFRTARGAVIMRRPY